MTRDEQFEQMRKALLALDAWRMQRGLEEWPCWPMKTERLIIDGVLAAIESRAAAALDEEEEEREAPTVAENATVQKPVARYKIAYVGKNTWAAKDLQEDGLVCTTLTLRQAEKEIREIASQKQSYYYDADGNRIPAPEVSET